MLKDHSLHSLFNTAGSDAYQTIPDLFEKVKPTKDVVTLIKTALIVPLWKQEAFSYYCRVGSALKL